MPKLKTGEVYKRGPHAGMTKGSGKKQPKSHAEEMSEKKPHKGKPNYMKKEPIKGKVISHSKHHPFNEPEKYSKEKLSEAHAHMRKHGG